MKRSIFSRVFGSIILVSFIAIIIVSGLTLKNQIDTFHSSVLREKKVLINFLEVSFRESDQALVSALDRLKNSLDTSFLWVTKQDGTVFYSDNEEMIGEVINDPFVDINQFKKRSGLKNGRRVDVIARPITNGKQELTVILGVNMAEVSVFLGPAFIRAFSIFLGAVLLSVFLALWLTERTISPLIKLRGAIGNVAAGNFNQKIKIQTGDEIEEIGKEFNKMALNLKNSQKEMEEAKKVLEIKIKARTKELEELTESLEEKVEARTEDLERKVEELEKFHKLTVGREKKMIELKEENKKLKEEIKEVKEKSKE
jgi:methyl-accepting chemotaxis protein